MPASSPHPHGRPAVAKHRPRESRHAKPKPRGKPHRCLAVGCPKEVPAKFLMCQACWSLVPHDVRHRLWGSYTRGQEHNPELRTPAWWGAATEAVCAVGLLTGRLNKLQAYARLAAVRRAIANRHAPADLPMFHALAAGLSAPREPEYDLGGEAGTA